MRTKMGGEPSNNPPGRRKEWFYKKLVFELAFIYPGLGICKARDDWEEERLSIPSFPSFL